MTSSAFRQVGNAIAHVVINVDENGNPAGGASDYTRLMQANDLYRLFGYADFGTADERLLYIDYSSSDLGLSCIENYQYQGSPGAYYLAGIARAMGTPG